MLVMRLCFVVFLLNCKQTAAESCYDVCRSFGTIANCSGKDLPHPPTKDAFSFLVTQLDMSDNTCIDLKDELEGYSLLQTLTFKNNKIHRIKTDAFQGLINLRQLDLSGNKIFEFEEETFAYVPSLRVLNLENNSITDIKENLFSGLSKLEILYLSYNYISNIGNPFSQNIKLRFLSLEYNKLKAMNEDTFKQLFNLEHLDLSGNEINSIRHGAFDSLKNLKWLSLSNNKIKHLPTIPCERHLQLQHLNLSSNLLTYLNTGTFCSCKDLVNLSLAHNQITILHPHSLYGISNLEYLDISFNNITSLTPQVFTNYKEDTHVTEDFSQECFKYKLNYKIRYFNIERNMIASIYQCMFVVMEGVEVVQMSGNLLRYLDLRLFRPLNKLRTLNASLNNLGSLDQQLAHWLRNTSADVLLSGNPWICSCDELYGAYEILAGNSSKKFNLECHLPADVLGKSWDVLEDTCKSTKNSSKKTEELKQEEEEQEEEEEQQQQQQQEKEYRKAEEDMQNVENSTISETSAEIFMNSSDVFNNDTLQSSVTSDNETDIKLYVLISVSFFAFLLTVIIVVSGFALIRRVQRPNIDDLWWEDAPARKDMLSEM